MNTIGKRKKSHISFIFYYFDIINNKKVLIKRILYFNIWLPQDSCFFISALANAARHSVLPLYFSLSLYVRCTECVKDEDKLANNRQYLRIIIAIIIDQTC